MKIDHVTIAGSNLARLCEAFAGCGLHAVYGGPHSNGITHMAALGFRDGSYIELISFLERPGPSRFWPELIAADAGACAWCVGVADIQAESARLASLGIPVEGPLPFERQRPDGETVAWDLSFPGDASPGSLLPFLIQDRTPRSRRISPSPNLIDSPLAGIGFVLIAVRDLPAAVSLFRRIWEWPAPMVQEDRFLHGAVALFPGAPVVLVQAEGGVLQKRTERWGDLPAAFGLLSKAFDDSCKALPIEAVSVWRDGALLRKVGWFRPAHTPDVLLAVVSAGQREG